MSRILCHNLPEWWRKGASVFLAFFWFFGLVAGVLTALSASDLLSASMRTAVFSRVSILGLASAVFLPFLFSAFAVYIQCPFLLLPIAFAKAFLFSYLGLGVIEAFGSAGWLIRVLLMFSDIVLLPVLFWFWIRYISGDSRYGSRATAVCISVAALVGSIDYCVISPFMANLIT